MEKVNLSSAILGALISFASACGVGIAVMMVYNHYINGVTVCYNPAFAETCLQICVSFLVVCSFVLAFVGWIVTDEK